MEIEVCVCLCFRLQETLLCSLSRPRKRVATPSSAGRRGRDWCGRRRARRRRRRRHRRRHGRRGRGRDRRRWRTAAALWPWWRRHGRRRRRRRWRPVRVHHGRRRRWRHRPHLDAPGRRRPSGRGRRRTPLPIPPAPAVGGHGRGRRPQPARQGRVTGHQAHKQARLHPGQQDDQDAPPPGGQALPARAGGLDGEHDRGRAPPDGLRPGRGQLQPGPRPHARAPQQGQEEGGEDGGGRDGVGVVAGGPIDVALKTGRRDGRDSEFLGQREGRRARTRTQNPTPLRSLSSVLFYLRPMRHEPRTTP